MPRRTLGKNVYEGAFFTPPRAPALQASPIPTPPNRRDAVREKGITSDDEDQYQCRIVAWSA